MSEFLCFLCGKSFHDKSSLRQHKHGVHSTAELPCNQCNKILQGSTGKTFRDTNGEFIETVHSSLRIHEESHGYKVVKQIGSPGHLKKSQQSITSFNSLRAGFCSPKDFTLRRKSSPHSSSPSPSPLSSPRSSHLSPLNLMF